MQTEKRDRTRLPLALPLTAFVRRCTMAKKRTGNPKLGITNLKPGFAVIKFRWKKKDYLIPLIPARWSIWCNSKHNWKVSEAPFLLLGYEPAKWREVHNNPNSLYKVASAAFYRSKVGILEKKILDAIDEDKIKSRLGLNQRPGYELLAALDPEETRIKRVMEWRAVCEWFAAAGGDELPQELMRRLHSAKTVNQNANKPPGSGNEQVESSKTEPEGITPTAQALSSNYTERVWKCLQDHSGNRRFLSIGEIREATAKLSVAPNGKKFKKYMSRNKVVESLVELEGLGRIRRDLQRKTSVVDDNDKRS